MGLRAPAVSLALTALAIASALCGRGAAMAATGAVRIFVSPQGSDAWSGRVATPSRADGPFASLERARDELRKLRQAGELPGGAVVGLGPGVYELTQTFELGPDDSGTADAPITYAARPGAQVRLVGGREVTGWRPVTDRAILDRLDEGARGNVLQAGLKALGIEKYGQVGAIGGRLELFFNDTPMTIARWPNEGFVAIAGLLGEQPRTSHGIEGDGVGKIIYHGDRPSRWGAENDIWLYGFWFWDWASAFQKVAALKPEQSLMELAEPYHGYGYRVGGRYYALNLLAELDQPGEWYLDRESGTLYFWPPGPIEQGRATVSLIPALLSFTDVSHVTFRGLTLEATRGTAVVVSGGEHVRLVDCVIRNTGATAVSISGGDDHSVEGCHIHGTAQGGVTLRGGDRPTLTPGRHTVSDCEFHDLGRIARTYCPAVWVHGVGNTIAHNRIYNLPHGAIMLTGNEHRIEFNDISNVCYETGDAGAFYMGRNWTERGNIIRYNYFHNMLGPGLQGGVQAVYLDDMASGNIVQGNILYKAGRAVLLGGGRDNLIENNIMVECAPAIHIDARAAGWARASVAEGGEMPMTLREMPYTEPPWSERYPELLTVLADQPALPKGNIVRRNISWGGRWLDIEELARPLVVFEDNLVDVDPLFIDAQNGDFRLRADSPAWGLGFQPIPVERIGPRRGPK